MFLIVADSDSSGSEGGARKALRAKWRGLGSPAHALSQGRRRRTGLSARERNMRRLESNERERMRMHSLNDAFEVSPRSLLHSLSRRRPLFLKCELF